MRKRFSVRSEKIILSHIEVRKISFVSKFFSVRNSETNIFRKEKERRGEKRREEKRRKEMRREE